MSVRCAKVNVYQEKKVSERTCSATMWPHGGELRPLLCICDFYQQLITASLKMFLPAEMNQDTEIMKHCFKRVTQGGSEKYSDVCLNTWLLFVSLPFEFKKDLWDTADVCFKHKVMLADACELMTQKYWWNIIKNIPVCRSIFWFQLICCQQTR